MAKGKYMYVPPLIIEEMEDVMREEDLTIKAEALRKVAKYSQVGRAVKKRVDVRDFDKIIPTIPIGQKILPKKVKLKDVFRL